MKVIEISSQGYSSSMKGLGGFKNPVNPPIQFSNINKRNTILNFIAFTISDNEIDIMSFFRERPALLLKNSYIVSGMNG